jgi:arginine decarboxylase
MQFIPKKVFLVKGVGRHREKLASFEEALRDARIARFNIVQVSSIFPPRCKLISAKKGLALLKSGQIIYTVMSRNESNENRRLMAASIGIAIPADRNQYGYLAEHHSFGQTEEQAGEYSEDLAASMLATILGLDFDTGAAWDKKEELWKISGKFVKTANITQSAIGAPGGIWTSVVAAAVFVS